MKIIPFNRRHEIFIKNINNAICLHYDSILCIHYVKNGNIHNEKFHAGYYVYPNLVVKHYRLHGNLNYHISSNKSWKKKVKELKRQEKLKVFK